MNLAKLLPYLTSTISVVVLFLFVTFMGCNDPTLVGKSLFDDEIIDLNFTDTINITTKTVKGDTSFYTNNRTFFLGELKDDLFGESRCELYLDIVRPAAVDSFSFIEIDSIVLTILYDSVGYDTDAILPQTVEIYQLTEEVPDTAYTDTVLGHDLDMVNYGSVGSTVLATPKDTTVITDYVKDTILNLNPQMRIRLKDDFFETVFKDSVAMSGSSDSTFVAHHKGFLIKTNSENTEKSILALNLFGANYITVYYKLNDNKHTLDIPIGQNRFSNFSHDYTDALIEDYINSPNQSDSLLFVQGMAGTNMVITMEDAVYFEDKLLNYAELEFFVKEEDQQNIYPGQILATKYYIDDDLVFSRDFTFGNLNGNFKKFHDGYLVEDVDNNGVRKYRVIITAQLNYFLNNTSLNKKVVISVINKSSSVGQTIIYGANSKNYPARLKAIFTNP